MWVRVIISDTIKIANVVYYKAEQNSILLFGFEEFSLLENGYQVKEPVAEPLPKYPVVRFVEFLVLCKSYLLRRL